MLFAILGRFGRADLLVAPGPEFDFLDLLAGVASGFSVGVGARRRFHALGFVRRHAHFDFAPIGSRDLLGLLADAAGGFLGGETRAAFGVVEVDDADLDHAAFARRSHLLRHQLLALGALLVLFDLLHLDARIDVLAFGRIDATSLFAGAVANFDLLLSLAFFAFRLGVHLVAGHADLMRASAKIRSSLRGGTGGTVAGGDDVAFVAFVGAAAASVLLLGVFRVTHLLSRRRAFARFGDAFELFDAAFFDLDLPEFVAGLALGDGLERAQLLALHEGAAALGLAVFRLLAIRVAHDLFEVGAFRAFADALLQVTPFGSGLDVDALFAGRAAAALRGRVLERDALLLRTSALVLRLLQFLTRLAFDRFQLAVIRLNVLTFKGFATTIIHFDDFLAFLASRLLDFGTDFPNASEMGTFAFVVGVKLVLPLVLLAEEVVVERSAFTAAARSPRLQLYLQIALGGI